VIGFDHAPSTLGSFGHTTVRSIDALLAVVSGEGFALAIAAGRLRRGNTASPSGHGPDRG
jgi:hypothetical protein